MDLYTSSYLEAIQAIPGLTPGEKYKELNSISKKFVSDARSYGNVENSPESLENVPELLVPLIKLEIAKTLKQNDVIVDALKSDDCGIVDRALRINWFFQADNKETINVEYFEKNLFPYITLNTRIKLIKKLIASFSSRGDTVAAESFYTWILKCYGKNQAEPLLVACSEAFIWKTIIRQKVILSCRMIKLLFVKYPELVVRYLKLSTSKEEDCKTRDSHRVNIYKYQNFLPRLIKYHLKSLIELIEMHNSTFNIILSNKATERFLKSNVDVVLDKPILYTKMMPLKLIATKITKSQYKSMFANVFPEKIRDFSYYRVKEYLQYYPEQERLSLLVETYGKIYKCDMLENDSLIDSKILLMLPEEERVRQARIKLKQQPDWHESGTNIETMWRCYLPLEETINLIKTELSKTSSSDERLILLKQMFFVCRINDDKDALLQTLRYFTTRHKNEQFYVIFDVLGSIVEYFDMSKFNKDHWSIINDFMKFLHIKDELTQRPTTTRQILIASIHFDLLHDIPVDEKIDILIEINVKSWNVSWCILEKHPEYDKICFDKMMSRIPEKYPKDNKLWSTYGMDVICNIVKSIHDFNNRNTGKNSSAKMEKISIKNYNWLLKAVEKVLKEEKKKIQWKLEPVIDYLKNYEPDLYEQWILINSNVIGNVENGEALKFMKQDPKNILDHCDDYLHSVKQSISINRTTQRFVKACIWYQDIPITFFVRCVNELSGDDFTTSLLILAILMKGSEFSRLIEPIFPQDTKSIDPNNDNAKSTYSKVSAISRAMTLVNPPISLNYLTSMCNGDFLSLALNCLTNVSRRCSADNVEKFAKGLVDSRVSVKKHGIRLYCQIARIADYRDFLVSLWKTEKHRTIRHIIFTKIHEFFINDACSENWMILRNCMDELKIDDGDILDYIENFNEIPDSYVGEYMPKLLEILDRLESDGFDAKRMTEHVSRFLAKIDKPTSKLLTEEFSERLLIKYFCNGNLSPIVTEAGMSYTLHSYLRADETKLDQRLNIFGKHYADILKKYWNVPDEKSHTCFPINWMTHKFVRYYVYYAGADSTNIKIMKTIRESILAVIKPQQDWTTYALLTFGIALGDAKDAISIAKKISETLPHLVEVFSPMLVIELADIVTKWLKMIVDGNILKKVEYKIIEVLCDIHTSDSCTLAAALLLRCCARPCEPIYNKITECLKNSQYPAAVSLVYEHINTCKSPD